MLRRHQTSDAQLRIGEFRDSGFDASHRPGMTTLAFLMAHLTSRHLSPWSASLPAPHPWPAPRRLSFSHPRRFSSAPPANRRRFSEGWRGALQALDLPVRGIELLLHGRREFRDGLLQEIDIALQATGAALHGFFDGADFDTGNVLGLGSGGCQQARRQSHRYDRRIRPIIESLIETAPSQSNCCEIFDDTTLRPHSRVDVSRGAF